MLSKQFQNLTGIVILLGVLSVVYAGIGDGGSRCPDASCTGPPGADCQPTYDRDDGCCPVWHCSNGMTAYGKSGSSSSGSSSFSYSSSSGGGMPGGMGGGAMPSMGGLLGNLFGGLGLGR